MSDSTELEYQDFGCACGPCLGGADHETAWNALAQSGGNSTGSALAQGGSGMSTSIQLSEISSDGYDVGDYLIYGSKWTMSEITYSFTNNKGDYGYDDHAGRFNTLNTKQKAVSVEVFDLVDSVSGLSFLQVSGSADRTATIRIAEGAEGATAWAYLPSDHETGGDMWFNPDDYNNPVLGNYEYMTFMHELGHALGLAHGHTSGFTAKLPSAYDSHEYSVMTYRSAPGGPASLRNDYNGFSQSFMIADIKALQTLYGANHGYNSGNTTYSFSNTTGEMFIDGVSQGTPAANTIFRTIWDGDGTDTYDFSNYATALDIDLTPGGVSDLSADSNAQNARIGQSVYASGHVYNALQHDGDARSLIENAIGGSGNDRLVGNAANNVLTGGTGNDSLTGGAGNDSLFGGAGDDVAIFSGASSGYQFALSDGLLQVTGEGIDILGADVERLQFSDQTQDTATIIQSLGGSTGGTDPTPDPTPDPNPTVNQITGTAGRDTINGTSGDDIIEGVANNDRLYGLDGNDRLVGGLGNDKLYGGAGDDTLETGAGTDQVYGGAGSDLIIADAASKRITIYDFEQGADRIDLTALGATSLGALSIAQASRNTLIEFGSTSLSISDAVASDFDNSDFVFAVAPPTSNNPTDPGTTDPVLPDGTLRGTAERDVIRGSGSDETLLGLAGNDRLYGGGGNDTLEGGDGNDSLNGGGGDDRIVSGTGKNMMHGGSGADTFAISAGMRLARIMDFSSSDLIDLSDTGATDYSQLKFKQKSNSVLIEYKSIDLQIKKAIVSDFSASNFVFGGTSAASGLAEQNTSLRLRGTEGDDTLEAEGSRHVMTGRGGDDVFVFDMTTRFVRIRDFGDGNDTLDLSALNLSGFDDLVFRENARATVVTAQDLTLKIKGVTIDDLGEDIFLF